MKRSVPYFLVVGVLLVLDQASKSWVAAKIGLFQTVRVIPGFFNLTHVRNKGAIFGVFNHVPGHTVALFLTGLSVLAFILVLVYFFKTPPQQTLTRFTLALIMAGALGNQIDRIVRGTVVDFLEIHVRHFYWPTFNLADACVSVGAVLLIYIFLVRRTA
ncbi:MAG: signal peptidase II [Candidatus Aminicenantales bacterium]|jgi:signal peptidase II